jgi:hypothetical protein
MRLRSCSKTNVLGGVEVFIGGGPAAVGGAEEACCFGFAETEAGTNDIMEVAAFLTGAGAPLMPDLAGFTPVLGFKEFKSDRAWCVCRPDVRALRLFGVPREC